MKTNKNKNCVKYKNIVSNDIFAIMEKKWNIHINNELIETVRLLNLEQNFKYTKKTLDFIIMWGRIYLTSYNLIENTNNNSVIEDTIRLQLNEFILRHNDFACINSENEKLQNKYMEQKRSMISSFYGIYIWCRIMNCLQYQLQCYPYVHLRHVSNVLFQYNLMFIHLNVINYRKIL